MKALNNLSQTALYWSKLSEDGRGGVTYAAGIEVICHWIESQKLILAADGRERISQAQIIVNIDMKPGDLIALGKKSDLGDPSTDPYSASVSALEIVAFGKSPSIKGDEFMRKVYI